MDGDVGAALGGRLELRHGGGSVESKDGDSGEAAPWDNEVPEDRGLLRGASSVQRQQLPSAFGAVCHAREDSPDLHPDGQVAPGGSRVEKLGLFEEVPDGSGGACCLEPCQDVAAGYHHVAPCCEEREEVPGGVLHDWVGGPDAAGLDSEDGLVMVGVVALEEEVEGDERGGPERHPAPQPA